MASALEKVSNGELKAYELFRGVGWVACLDVHPATPGHTLLIPDEPAETWVGLPDARLDQERHLGTQLARWQMERLSEGGPELIRAYVQLIPGSEAELTALTDDSVAQKAEFGPRRINKLIFGDDDPWPHFHYTPSYIRGDTAKRMHPDSGRMQQPIDSVALQEVQELLRFPDSMQERITEELSQMAGLAAEL